MKNKCAIQDEILAQQKLKTKFDDLLKNSGKAGYFHYQREFARTKTILETLNWVLSDRS